MTVPTAVRAAAALELKLRQTEGQRVGVLVRAHDGKELQAIKDTLDQLEPVTQQPTQARTAHALYAWPLALALLLSVLLVVAVQWPDNLLQRLLRKPRFLQPHPEWRQRLKRLRLRRRR